MAIQWCLLIVSIILNIVFFMVYVNVNRGGDLSWTRKAAEEAEEVASITCSRHGLAFLDGFASADGENPVCECYACYTGPDCSLVSLPCLADVDSGNPIYLEPYWMKQKEKSGVIVSGWHRLGYRFNNQPPNNNTSSSLVSFELEKYIRKLHELVGNAVSEDKYIVFGTGSTQLLNAAVLALSSSSSSSFPAFVVASTPFYPIYERAINFFQSRAYEFKGDTALWKNKTNSTNATFIEFVTSPNNPDGLLKETVLVGPTVKTIHDRVYYWPHYTAIPAPANDVLMLFSTSKLTGHAGSRFGWALVKDKDVYEKMMDYVAYNTLGVSHDAQLRIFKLLKTIVEGGGREIFEYGHEIMHQRWKRLSTIMSISTRFSIQHIPPQFCAFYQRVRGPSPAYGWLKCERQEDKSCYEVLKAAGIIGREGKIFGVGDNFVRLSLLKSQDDFDLLLQHLEILVSSEATSYSKSHLSAI